MKYFNTNGICYPEEHYMINIEKRLAEIRELVDQRKYFTINRARQYGKTTTLNLLVQYLSDRYTVFFISFEGMGSAAFGTESAFCHTLCRLLYDTVHYEEVPSLDEPVKRLLSETEENGGIHDIPTLSRFLSCLCQNAARPIVLMIDETDQVSDYKVFLDFLGMLRSQYLKRATRPSFQSVILAGIYDIKNLKQRSQESSSHMLNSPWNIAADFRVNMNFQPEDISQMLGEYAEDKKYPVNIQESAHEIYRYTSGYPYLVSRICKSIDENCVHRSPRECWSKPGISEAVKTLLNVTDPLFDDMLKKITDCKELKEILYAILFRGESYPYNPDNFPIQIGVMFGFLTEQDSRVVVSNRIFETRLYNLFLSEDLTDSIIYQSGDREKNQFVRDGKLNMELVLEKFMLHYQDVYGNSTEKFLENNARRMFLLYLKPIINGTGNYYIEAQTRDQTRTDVVVDYLGEQFVIELKLWRGDEYHKRGRRQLVEYLEYYHLDKGYLLSFNFNKNKTTGIREISVGNRRIMEVVV